MQMQTYISAMLLQSYLNKRQLSQLDRIDKLYIKSALSRLLQRSKIDFVGYKIKYFQIIHTYI